VLKTVGSAPALCFPIAPPSLVQPKKSSDTKAQHKLTAQKTKSRMVFLRERINLKRKLVESSENKKIES